MFSEAHWGLAALSALPDGLFMTWWQNLSLSQYLHQPFLKTMESITFHSK